jgi:hypothetical protein
MVSISAKKVTQKISCLCTFKVDSGIGLTMVNVLYSTLEWTKGEVIVNSGIGSHTTCFSLGSASVYKYSTYCSGDLYVGALSGDQTKIWQSYTNICIDTLIPRIFICARKIGLQRLILFINLSQKRKLFLDNFSLEKPEIRQSLDKI